MKSLFLSVLVSFLLISCNNKNQKKDLQSESSLRVSVSSDKVEFAVLGKPDESQLDALDLVDIHCTINGIKIKINPEGQLFWGDGYKKSVKLIEQDFIEMAYFYMIDNLLFLFYIETDMDGSTSFAECINLETAGKLWKTEIYGFNLGTPYIKSSFAYVTTLGLVGKINMETGEYEYKFDELYDFDKTSFNNFDTIIFKDNETLFLSENFNSGRIDSLIVDEITKKIKIIK